MRFDLFLIAVAVMPLAAMALRPVRTDSMKDERQAAEDRSMDTAGAQNGR